MKALRRSAFDWSAGRSKGAPQLVLSAGGRRIDTQATGIGGGPRLRQSARLPRRASVSARSPETPAWDEQQASASGCSAPDSLLHRPGSSNATSTIEFPAGRASWRRRCAAMTVSVLAGRRRSPATMPGHHCGRPPRNKGLRYPAAPPTAEEIVAVMRCAGGTPHGLRRRSLIVLLWRAGLRISKALALAENDLSAATGGVLVRHGKGGKRRQAGMDRWASDQIQPWLDHRLTLPVGALLCVIDGPTAGRRGRRRPSARPCGASPRSPACGAASRRTSSATHMPSRWRARRPAQRHPAPARRRESRHHVDPPPGHRQQRNHQHRLRAPGAAAPGERRPSLIVVVHSVSSVVSRTAAASIATATVLELPPIGSPHAPKSCLRTGRQGSGRVALLFVVRSESGDELHRTAAATRAGATGVPVDAPSRAFHRAGLAGHLRGGDGRRCRSTGGVSRGVPLRAQAAEPRPSSRPLPFDPRALPDRLRPTAGESVSCTPGLGSRLRRTSGELARAAPIRSRVRLEAGPAANNPGLRAVVRRHAPSATRQRTLEANGIDRGAGRVSERSS